MEFDGDYDIKIDPYLYDRFVDALTKYAEKATNDEELTIYVYTTTFQLFNMNFNRHRLEDLDSRLQGITLNYNDIEFPHWSKYDNLQIAIANTVKGELVNNERHLTGDIEVDKKMLSVYLDILLDKLNISIMN